MHDEVPDSDVIVHYRQSKQHRRLLKIKPLGQVSPRICHQTGPRLCHASAVGPSSALIAGTCASHSPAQHGSSWVCLSVHLAANSTPTGSVICISSPRFISTAAPVYVFSEDKPSNSNASSQPKVRCSRCTAVGHEGKCMCV